MPSGVYERKSLKDRMSKFSVDAATGCWNWTGARDSWGYGAIGVDGKLRGAHRVSYELHNGPFPNEMLVCHRCDNPGCVNPKHLFLGTNAENMADRNAKGRQARGGIHPQAKLTEAEVVAIRSANGTHREIGERFGISKSQVSNILTGKHWKFR